MSILGLIVFIIVLNQIIKIIYSLFKANTERKGSRQSKRGKSTINVQNQQPQKKIFSSDEGEYVDFEEIQQDTTEDLSKEN